MYEISITNRQINTSTPSGYIRFLNDFLAFQANAGRVKDNFEKLLHIYLNKKSENEISRSLNSIYQERNNVIHGRKVPYSLFENLVLIAPPEGEKNDDKKWNDKMSWNQFDKKDLVFLVDYLSETLHEICIISNDILGQILGPIRGLIKQYNIIITSIGPSKANIDASGSIYYHNSGSSGYSE